MEKKVQRKILEPAENKKFFSEDLRQMDHEAIIDLFVSILGNKRKETNRANRETN